MDLLNQLPESVMSILILCLVIGIKYLININHQLQTSGLFVLYCQQMALKVNKDSHSIGHRKVAGAIATLITFTPLVIILWLFEAFVAVPWLWDGLLLFVALGPLNLKRVAAKEAHLLARQDKYQAKQHLAPYVLRETDQLSVMGLAKTTIEMTLLRSFQQQFAIAFYFLFVGPLAAISFRLLLEMHYQWNVKQRRFNAFGSFVSTLVDLIQWLPGRLYLVGFTLVTLNQSVFLYWRLTKRYFFQLNNQALISYFAYSLGIKLGGVAMYQKEKLRRIAFNEQGRQPEVTDIHRAIKQLNLMLTLSLGLLISYGVIATLLNS